MQRDAAEEEVEVVLAGGPEGGPGRTTVPAGALADRVAVCHLNGREHFKSTDESAEIDGRPAPVYRWIYSTKIAE
ncbi:DUF5988 family protein [Streptomyces sp. NPDC059134]|uniref:DUF5988 family protein n=1 Tax=Streptomyces sp. NPDC059134 TaxID=3346738 RepID=UPI0036951389